MRRLGLTILVLSFCACSTDEPETAGPATPVVPSECVPNEAGEFSSCSCCAANEVCQRQSSSAPAKCVTEDDLEQGQFFCNRVLVCEATDVCVVIKTWIEGTTFDDTYCDVIPSVCESDLTCACLVDNLTRVGSGLTGEVTCEERPEGFLVTEDNTP